jgi:membrane associated rhomboid family serine protease
MLSVTECIWDLVIHPFCTVWILLISWVWTRVFYDEFDPKEFALSYSDCIQRKEYWRIFCAPFIHSSFVHLLLNISCLWNLRYLEVNYGTWFLLKYSILLCSLEAMISFSMIKTGSELINNQTLIQILNSLPSFGSSGLILCWLEFQAVEKMEGRTDSIFLLFGIIPLSPIYVPLVLLSIFYLFIPKISIIYNFCGILCGYFLAVGLLSVLDGYFWTISILMNIIFVVVSSLSSSSNLLQNDRNLQSEGYRYYTESRLEFLEVPLSEAEEDPPHQEVELTPILSHSNHDDDDSERKHSLDEESLQPLLSSATGNNPDQFQSSWTRLWPSTRSHATEGTIPIAMSSEAANSRLNIPHRLLINSDDT